MYSSDNNEIPSWLLGKRTFNSLNIVFFFIQIWVFEH